MQLSNHTEGGLEASEYADFVAFTSTFYKDDVEGQIRSEACFEMLDNALKLGIRVVVGDGGSGNDFLERVRKYPNITLIHSGKSGENTDLSMAGERRFTGKIAMDNYPDSKYFLWLEPEKAELMKETSIDAILAPMRAGTSDIVVPSRISKDTLPHQQRSAENRANLRALDIIKHGEMRPIHNFRDQGVMIGFDFNGKASIYGDPYFGTKEQYKDGSLETTIGKNYEDAKGLDLWFGPKAFTRESMEQDFLPYKGAKWDGIITPVLAGKLRGKNVVDVPVHFSYPPEQSALEQDPAYAESYAKKRRIQYRYIIKTIRDIVKNVSHPETIMDTVLRSIELSNSDTLIRLTDSFPLSFAHQDSRRMIEEYNGDNFSVQRFTIKSSNLPLGNHFHIKGDNNISEVFIIEAGKGTVLLQNIDESGTPFGEQEVIHIKKGDIVVIPPFQVHTFFLDNNSIMRGIRPYPFDEKDMDMNSFPLEIPRE